MRLCRRDANSLVAKQRLRLCSGIRIAQARPTGGEEVLRSDGADVPGREDAGADQTQGEQ